MKIIFIKSVFILLLLLTSCKSVNENKIIGSWKGTCENKAMKFLKPRYCEMEFAEDGKFFTRQSDLNKIELNSPRIKNYTIVGDSLLTDLNGKKDSYFIEFISDNKMILIQDEGSMNNFYYELKKE